MLPAACTVRQENLENLPLDSGAVGRVPVPDPASDIDAVAKMAPEFAFRKGGRFLQILAFKADGAVSIDRRFE